MVMYSVATNTSVGALFMAGVIPGNLLLAMVLGGTTWYRAMKFNYPRMPRHSFGERLKAFRESIWGLLLIVVVMGGIYSGMFTPTEAAAMSAVYAFIVAVFVYKDLSLKRRAAGAAQLGEHVGDAALHHHQRRALLVHHDQREHPAGALADWMLGHGLG
jgi:C4-dicarboxylate transporter DctM subunit